MVFEEGPEVSPRSNEFRVLVQGARGKTMVDADLLSAVTTHASASADGRPTGWTVRMGGDDLRYSAGEAIGGICSERMTTARTQSQRNPRVEGPMMGP